MGWIAVAKLAVVAVLGLAEIFSNAHLGTGRIEASSGKLILERVAGPEGALCWKVVAMPEDARAPVAAIFDRTPPEVSPGQVLCARRE